MATWPAVGSFRSAFIGWGVTGYGEAGPGDHRQNIYRFWLFSHQLARGEPPWRDPYSFQPLIDPLLTLGWWPFALPFWPLEAAFGPVVAWNVLLLAVVVGAGLATYGWLRALDLGPAAAALGGLAFAVAPYRIDQSGGHLHAWIALFLALALFGLERARAAQTRRAAHGFGALAALALVSIPLSGQVHFAIGAIPLVLAYTAVRYAPIPALWTAVGALGAIGAGLFVRLTLIADAYDAERSVSEVSRFSAEPIDLVDRFHPGGSEELVYLGWLTPLLALAGLVLLWRRRRGLALVLGAAAVVPVLLALGTNFPVYEWLRTAVPPLRYPRVPARLMPIAELALAALTAVAAARLAAAAGGRRALAVSAALLILVAGDLIVQPLRATEDDPGNAAYAALDDSAGRMLELPLFDPGSFEGSVYDYYQLQARRERPAGYASLAPEEPYAFAADLDRLSCGAWLPGDREALARIGVGSILFHEGLYRSGEVPGAWFAWRALEREGWSPRARGGRVTLFTPGAGSPAAGPPEPRGELVFCDGWFDRRTVRRQAPFWIRGGGTLRLQLSSIEPTSAWLWVDGERGPTFRVDRRGAVTVDLGGKGWHVVVVEVGQLRGDPPEGVRLLRLDRS